MTKKEAIYLARALEMPIHLVYKNREALEGSVSMSFVRINIALEEIGRPLAVKLKQLYNMVKKEDGQNSEQD